MGNKKQFYAVKVGRKRGIYDNWNDCKRQVSGYSRASFKGFSTRQEAESFLAERSTEKIAAAGPTGISAEAEKGTQALHSSAGRVADEPGVLVLSSSDEESDRLWKKRKNISEETGPAAAGFKADPGVLYRLEFDGASKHNPGPAGAGAILMVDSTRKEVGTVCLGLGTATNNVAEYTALIMGMEAAVAVGVQKLKVIGDSMLAVKQVKGEWQVKHDGLVPLHKRVRSLQNRFQEFSIAHVLREHNFTADALSNEAIATGGWHGLKTPQGIVDVSLPQLAEEAKEVAKLASQSGSRKLSPSATASNRRTMGLLDQQPRKTMIGGCWAARRNSIALPIADRLWTPTSGLPQRLAALSSWTVEPLQQLAEGTDAVNGGTLYGSISREVGPEGFLDAVLSSAFCS